MTKEFFFGYQGLGIAMTGNKPSSVRVTPKVMRVGRYPKLG